MMPFSDESHTGCWVHVVGMEMKVYRFLPLHKVMLHSDLFQGEIALGVKPALPVKGVTLILGNGAAGGCVWGGVSPPPVVSSVLLVRKQPDDDTTSFLTACAVTRSMSQNSPPQQCTSMEWAVVRQQRDCVSPCPMFLSLLRGRN